MIRVDQIQRAVTEHYGLAPGAIKSCSRIKEIARPRQQAMCLAVRLTNHSYVRIGHFFDRDHSTIMSGTRLTEQRQRADPKVAETLREVTLVLLRKDGR